ncbi:m-AAA protease-interacting protein 1, mitochondrial [Eumeta japonica]|uniref:M-AAA protease-interacting protein 1, mitochondrial n=1 Tax=Eumeta variegata TaxID=151549 RepID=A0A4C1W1K2_EUMVA|nr:m-AAA protease-interacting protein 1, mitochondrial [Eumeta japonica]
MAMYTLWRRYGQLTAAVGRAFIHSFNKDVFTRNITPIHKQKRPLILAQLPPIAPQRKCHFTSLIGNRHGFAFEKSRPVVTSLVSRNFSAAADAVAPKKKRKVPKLILLQNPFKWLMIKIDFSVLRNIWDPAFKEKEFKFGTKQAIARVTQVISEGRFDELNGLLTKAARKSLLRDLERNWTPRKRSLLALDNRDIQISSPRRVYFIKIADKKFCDVDMAFLALKWVPINSIDSLIFSEIFARFHREYTPHCIPEWTIAYFKVTRLEIIRK